MAEGYVDSADFHKRRSSFLVGRILLGLSNLLSLIIDDLSGGGYQRYELAQLRAEIFDVITINKEEKACLGLLWKTSRPVECKPGAHITRMKFSYKMSPCTLPRFNGEGVGEAICKS